MCFLLYKRNLIIQIFWDNIYKNPCRETIGRPNKFLKGHANSKSFQNQIFVKQYKKIYKKTKKVLTFCNSTVRIENRKGAFNIKINGLYFNINAHGGIYYERREEYEYGKNAKRN